MLGLEAQLNAKPLPKASVRSITALQGHQSAASRGFMTGAGGSGQVEVEPSMLHGAARCRAQQGACWRCRHYESFLLKLPPLPLPAAGTPPRPLAT